MSITKIKSCNNAGWVLQKQGWNLDLALSWFYQHRYDDEFKEFLISDDESTYKKQGKNAICTSDELNFKTFN